MNAGELTVRVRAELSEFDGQMRELETKAGDAGIAIAGQLNDKIEKESDFANLISKKFSGPGAFLSLSNNLANAIRTGSEEGIKAGLENLATSIPVIGTAYNLGSALGEAIASRIFKDENNEIGNMLLQSEQTERIVSQRELEGELERKAIRQQAELTGDEIAVAGLDLAEKLRKLKLQENEDLQNALTEQESDLIRRNAAKIRTLETQLYQDRVKKLRDKQAEEEQKRIDDNLKLLQDALDQEDEIRRKAQEKADKARKDAERKAKEDLKARQEAVGEGETALGTFKFDAYPQTLKRQNDERLVKAAERTASAVSRTQSMAGFN